MKTIKYLLPVAVLAFSSFASAGSRDSNNVVVKYGDLNLNSQAGVASLHKRIRNAAESVCSQYETRILGLRAAYEECIDDAVASSVSAVGNVSLTQYHAVKSGQVLASNQR